MPEQENEERLLHSVALQNAKAILLARERVERELVQAKEALERKSEQLAQQREWFEVTLSSIGDGVIATDSSGKVTFLNHMAEAMTGWKSKEATGQALESVFQIIDEQTRQPITNPIATALREGITVGLANHTALVARDGKETAIEDSAAPIQDSEGKITGAVIVFHDATERRRAHEALRRSHRQFSALLDQSPAGVVLVDADFRIRHVNARAFPVFGEISSLLDRDFGTVLLTQWPREVAERILQRFRHTLETGDPYAEGGFSPGTRRGIEEFYDWEIHRVSLPEGPHGLACYFTNVSEHVAAKNALEESEKRFRATFNQAAVGMAIASLQGRFEQVNQRFSDILGYSPEELSRCSFLDITFPEDLPETRANIRRLLANEVTDLGYEKRYFRKDRSVVWSRTSVTLLKDGAGRPRAFVGLIEDISERKQSEETRSRLAAAVESSDDAIITTTLDGIIDSWNEGAKRMYGYTAREAVGRPVTILIPSDRADEEPRILERLRRGDPIDHYETVRMNKDGTLLAVSLTVSPIKDGTGRITGGSKIARDITARKRAEEALGHAQAALRRHAEDLENQVQERTAALREKVEELEAFSYSISHDLRAPLRAMQGYATILAEQCAPRLDNEEKDYLRRIAMASVRMDRLIQDVLSYSRVARDELKLEAVNPGTLVRDILDSYAMFHPPAVEVRLEGSFPTVAANPAVLTQCISNLLGNAVKFVAAGVQPRVIVWAEHRAGEHRARLCFTDNGLGIGEESQQRIFEIFQRLSQGYEGTGIGLAIVKKGIERMGGKVGLESAPGRGSTFWLELNEA